MDYEDKYLANKEDVVEEGPDNFKITIKDIQGDEIELDVKKTDKIEDVATNYRTKKGISGQSQILLYFGGKAIKGTLKDNNVQDGDTLHCSVRLRGGK